jgi:prepilin-type N-terminal cleavage/methylation domain-containing protein
MRRLMLAHNRRAASRGFTLVEILIVVIILGILASIIIGLIGNTSKDAGVSSLKDNLRSMRSALQIYLAQHATYPSGSSFADQLTLYSDASGATVTVRDPAHPYGPYILAMPPLPIGTEKGKSTVTTSSTYSAGFGWRYDATTGQFKANLPDTDVDETGIAYNTY